MTTPMLPRVALALLAATFVCCASLKTPTLQVEGLRVDKVRVTGAGIDVAFRVQNPNPEAILIERFEYQLKLNGRGLGRGYHSEPIRLEGFKDERLQSRFGLNFLRLPGAVREVLEQDRADVHVDGTFYVRRGDGLKKLRFSNGARVDLGR